MEKIKLILADDHQILREGVEAILGDEPTIQIVGQVSNGKELLELLNTVEADVILMDLNMPELDGLETTEYMKKHHPEVKILMLSMVNSEKIVGQLMNAGAMGYLSKSSGRDELIHGIQQVASGRFHLGTDITLNVLKKSAPQAVQVFDGPGHAPVDLSKREMEVLELISDGYSNQEIADKLCVSKRTIDSHRQNLMDKTQVKNTASLIKYAVSRGIIS
jgi:DNA-binding NarL/FixJ family response regulator